MSDGAVLVFARRPELGHVKTRLESAIGDQLTLAIYRAFLADTLTAAKETGARVLMAHTPGPMFPERALADDSFTQQGRTFGERFDHALAEASKRLPPGTPLMLIGADTPHLSPDFLRQAFRILDGQDAVIGPNLNGGFYLLGFSRVPIPIGEVFNHTANEEVAVLQRILTMAGFATTLLEPGFDIDLPEDLRTLIHLINFEKTRGIGWIPANTQRVLESAPIISLAVQASSSHTKQRSTALEAGTTAFDS